MKPVVDVMLIGAQKSGTTSLAQQLRSHPEICLSADKEPAFFNTHDDWRSGLGEYHGLFSPTPGQLCLEASTMYTFLPEFGGTHDRIHAYNPDVKLLYVMRDPVERTLSNYAFRRVRRLTSDPPEVAIVADPTFVNRSRYGMQMRPYFERFPAEQIHLMVFEEHLADPAGSLKEIAGFLGIAPDGFGTVDETARHASTGESRLSDRGRRIKQHPVSSKVLGAMPGPLRRFAGQAFRTTLERKPPVSDEFRERLLRMLDDDIAQVEEWLGRRVDTWSHRS
jgi:hypothetical protein